jgi:hypothetical protein
MFNKHKAQREPMTGPQFLGWCALALVVLTALAFCCGYHT